jgi:ornithine cyclodeaminase
VTVLSRRLKDRNWPARAIQVGRPNVASHSVGDILQPIASGAIRAGDVLGDLYDLVPGKVEGRRSAADITLFKNAGGGHLDLMTAELVLQRLTGQDPLQV